MSGPTGDQKSAKTSMAGPPGSCARRRAAPPPAGPSSPPASDSFAGLKTSTASRIAEEFGVNVDLPPHYNGAQGGVRFGSDREADPAVGSWEVLKDRRRRGPLPLLLEILWLMVKRLLAEAWSCCGAVESVSLAYQSTGSAPRERAAPPGAAGIDGFVGIVTRSSSE